MREGSGLDAARSASLDGLRGLAALIVVASHSSGLGMHLLPGVSLAGIGKYGVYLFFVLSAFLLSAQWLRAWAGRAVDGAYAGRYLRRRVLRIYPLYALVLLAGLALAPRGLGVPLDAAAFWRHLSLQEGRGIYWSIPVEFLYYLCIPLLTFGLSREVPVWVRLLGALALVAVLQWFFPQHRSVLNAINLLYYLPIFIGGTVAAWAMQQWPADGAAATARAWSWLDAMPLLVLILATPAVFALLGRGDELHALHRQYLGWGLFWGLVLLGMLRGYLPLWSRLLSRPFWRACGRWCFGIYLLHMPALYAAKRLPLHDSLKAWIGLALALVTAAAVYRLIERPAMRLGEASAQRASARA